MKIKIFKFLPTIAAARTIWSQEFQFFLIMNILALHFFFCDYTYLHLIFVLHILKLFLYLWKHFINQNKNYTFMIRKNQSFCNQIFASYLLKCSVKILRIFIFIFFNFLLLFLKYFLFKYSPWPRLSNDTNFIDFLKSYSGSKN